MHEGDLLTYNDKPLKLFDLDYTEMVYVEKGSFMMGDNNAERKNEKPEIKITFKSGFYIGKYIVTQELYEFMMGTNPSSFKGKHLPLGTSHNAICKGEKSFLTQLNAKIKVDYPALKGAFALPSEAQWEYAARGGKAWDKPKLAYAGSDNINDVAWYLKNSEDGIMPVGLKEPNALGLYDMSGNVWEWCADWYKKDLSNIPKDGSEVIQEGTDRVLRGGRLNSRSERCRVANREYHDPEYYSDDYCFRLVFSQV